MPPAAPGTPPRFSFGPTLVVLIAANLLVAVQALDGQWGYQRLVMVYWFEALVVGGLNALRMLVVGLASERPFGEWLARWVEPTPGARIATTLLAVGFFVVKFGAFALATGFWILMLPAFDGPSGGAGDRVLAALGEAVDALAFPVGALASSHAVSFAWNFLVRGEFRVQSLPGLVFWPYLRMALAMAVVVAGVLLGGMVQGPEAAILAVAVAVLCKTVVDAATHGWAHGRAFAGHARGSVRPAVPAHAR